MSKSKLTLLIDGNWLLMSRLSVISNQYADDYELSHQLQLLLIRSIKLVLKHFPDIDNIIFVADGGSWRNNEEIPDYLVDENGYKVEYKGNRERSDDINWDVIFGAYEELISLMQQNNINACREKFIEGDDWMYHWSTLLNEQGTNCIIWSKDNDLKQLINIDQNKCFTMWWNKDNGFFCPNFDDNNLNFLFNYSYNENDEIFRNIIKNNKYTKINKKEIILSKILKGDAGDNILPVILRKPKSKDSTKKYKISEKDINYDLDIHNLNEVKSYIHEIVNKKNYKDRLYHTENEIYDHFLYNKKMIVLEDESYPKYVKDIFEKYTDYNINKDIYPVENYLIATTNKLKGVLDLI